MRRQTQKESQRAQSDPLNQHRYAGNDTGVGNEMGISILPLEHDRQALQKSDVSNQQMTMCIPLWETGSEH